VVGRGDDAKEISFDNTHTTTTDVSSSLFDTAETVTTIQPLQPLQPLQQQQQQHPPSLSLTQSKDFMHQFLDLESARYFFFSDLFNLNIVFY
jgi:hypothetical protein